MQGNAPDEEYEDPHGECAREVARLLEALKPFAFLGSILNGKEKDTNIFVGQVTPDGVHHPVTFGDLRRAAKLIYG